MIDLVTNVTVVVRECGERSTDACVALLSNYFPQHTVHRVSGRPFHVTLRRSLELGLSEGRHWTLCVDADVLALPSIVEFLETATALPPHAFGVQALVFDKLLRVRRPAGNHLYRTSLIGDSLPHIPTEHALRPESAMIEVMAKDGHPFHQSFDVVGLHDFEQSPRDIYSKAFLHGHKHRYLMELFEPIWQELANSDEDYRVALAALSDVLREDDVSIVGRDHTEDLAGAAVKKLGVAEKPPLETMTPEILAYLLEVEHVLVGEVEDLRSKLQAVVEADLAAQERARLSNTTAKRQRARGFLGLLGNIHAWAARMRR